MRAFLDRAMSRIASRKLWAWLTATGALFAGALDSSCWVTVTVVYIGSQAAVDIAERLRR